MHQLQRRNTRLLRFVLCGLTLTAQMCIAANAGTIRPAASALLVVDGAPPDNTLVGQTNTAQITVSAYGGSVTIDSAALSGANGASYSITSNACVSGTVVTASVTCEIDIQFAPQQLGALTEAIAFATSVGPSSYDISADGLMTPILVSPTLMDFGFQPYGTTSASRTLTLKNPNPIPITLPFGYNQVLGTGDFYPQSTTCGTIPANGSCTFEVQFTPLTTSPEQGIWYVITGADDQNDGQEDTTTQVTFQGAGVENGATNVNLSTLLNSEGIGNEGGTVSGGGMDGAGNVYPNDFLLSSTSWSGQTFSLAQGAHSAIRQARLPLPAGQYYGVTLLATGVNGNQANQSFTVTYNDGTTAVIKQSLSDWKTPQHYAGESIAFTFAYRLTATGARHTGPYYMYAYTLPLDHTKTAASLTLPNSPDVVALAANVEVAGIPVTAELDSLYDVAAVGVDGQSVGKGIDGHGSAISYLQLSSAPLNELLLPVPPPNVVDAVSDATVLLPAGQFSTLQLDGMAVEGNLASQSLTINYQDGTGTSVSQGFSDWHTYQKYSRESVAVAMTYKLNPDGSQHPGTYNVYQYDIPIDSTKVVQSVTLPTTSRVVILSVALKP